MPHLVYFSEVGRLKKSWFDTFPERLECRDLLRSIKKNQAILSRHPDVDEVEGSNPQEVVGVVTAGWNTVGKWFVVRSFFVTADHPIAARPDKSFWLDADPDARRAAEAYADELRELKFENVKVTPRP